MLYTRDQGGDEHGLTPGDDVCGVSFSRSSPKMAFYLVFDDEGHGFSKKKNQIEANRRMLDFLDRHLKPGVSVR